MTFAYPIPIQPSTPQKFFIGLRGSIYRLRFLYCDTPEGGWIMDIADSADAPLVCGIPLVLGVDLLAQYEYLNIGGGLYVHNAGDPDQPPAFDSLGAATQLYFVPAGSV